MRLENGNRWEGYAVRRDLFWGSRARIRTQLRRHSILLRRMTLRFSSNNSWDYTVCWDTEREDSKTFILKEILNQYLPGGLRVVSLIKEFNVPYPDSVIKWYWGHCVDIRIDRRPGKTIMYAP
jgi:hypothetical protein